LDQDTVDESGCQLSPFSFLSELAPADVRALADSVSELLWTATPAGVTDYLNRRDPEHGETPSEAGTTGGWLESVHPEDIERVRRSWERSVEVGAPLALECRCRSADSEYRLHAVRALPVLNRRQELLRWIGVAVEIPDELRGARHGDLETSWGRRDDEALRAAERERRQLLERVISAQDDARARVARDLHDDAVQSMTALTLRLDLALVASNDPKLASQLAEAKKAATDVIESLRGLIYELHPPELGHHGLGITLGEELEQIRQEAGIQVRLEEELPAEPPIAAATVVYRIAHEALLNARKHARAQRISLGLKLVGGCLVVTVSDDGRGFVAGSAARGHLGLVSMRERAEAVGGSVRIESEPGSGTTVEIAVPLALQEVVA
jgi:signal transduction histidine kinase